MDIINNFKIENGSIRKNWDENTSEWYYSIVDVITLVTKSSDPRNYWKVQKNRLKKAQNKLVTECNQLKMLAGDGKFYLTDTAKEETILEIIKLIAPQYINVFKDWFDEIREVSYKNKSFFGLKVTPTLSTEGTVNSTYPQLENENVENNNINVDEEEFMLMVDGYFENNFLVIQAFVAGLNVSNLFVSSTCDVLTINGERELAKRSAECEDIEQELYWGKFSRTIKLPNEVDIENCEMLEKNGMLTVRLPLINKTKSRILKLKSL